MMNLHHQEHKEITLLHLNTVWKQFVLLVEWSLSRQNLQDLNLQLQDLELFG